MKHWILLVLAMIVAISPRAAHAACPVGDRPVVVGVPVSAPFVIEGAGGELTGFDIELWRLIADEMGCVTRFETIGYDERIPALAERRIDVVMGGMTITAEREAAVDFSHGYYNSGQSIMTRDETGLDVFGFAHELWTSTLSKFFFGLVLYVAFWAHVIWGTEQIFRKKNASDADKANDVQFDNGYWTGLLQAGYFVNVTITTVGYGDITPKTGWGRVLTLVMMWTGIAYGTIFLGAIVAFGNQYADATHAASSTDLKDQPVAAVRNTTGEAAAKGLGVQLVSVADLAHAAKLLADGSVRAVIFDDPNLRHYALGEGAGTVVVSQPLTEESYGFALQSGSPLRDAVNQGVLRIREDGRYEQLYADYFGPRL